MKTLLALVLSLCAVSAHAQIDFTPREADATFEGVKYTQTGFRSGQSLVVYEPPPGWALQGQGPRLQMRPDNVAMASATMESRPRPAETALDGPALQKLQEEIWITLPRDATNLKWEALDVNPVLLNRHETRRLTISYSAYAQSFKVTVIVCNFADQQIRFRLDAREADFDRLYDLFRRSLFTWQGLP